MFSLDAVWGLSTLRGFKSWLTIVGCGVAIFAFLFVGLASDFVRARLSLSVARPTVRCRVNRQLGACSSCCLHVIVFTWPLRAVKGSGEGKRVRETRMSTPLPGICMMIFCGLL